ncbi:MAG TPA: substrate-binding domain-containing protein [Dermatophilaceae bacterium]|nr:substrate-binding domain-containing protein [Dermatophilaceae bacterium]
MFTRESPPAALFATSSEIVLGVLCRARQVGLRVPDDLSIVAFGDPDWYEVLEAPITCYRQPLESVGLVAVQLMVARINGQAGPRPTQITINGHVIERQSAKAPATVASR